MTTQTIAPQTSPFTLREFFGRPRPALDWSGAALVLIDHQRDYVDGGLPLVGMEATVVAAAELLATARRHGAPVIHVVHVAPAGAPAFDPAKPGGQIIAELAPREGEARVAKTYANSFKDTGLHERLQVLGKKQLVIAGFMTHMCVSTTTRAAAELGYENFVVASACATRDLRGPNGETVAAAVVHATALAELGDSFATVLAAVPD